MSEKRDSWISCVCQKIVDVLDIVDTTALQYFDQLDWSWYVEVWNHKRSEERQQVLREQA